MARQRCWYLSNDMDGDHVGTNRGWWGFGDSDVGILGSIRHTKGMDDATETALKNTTETIQKHRNGSEGEVR